MDKLFCLLSTPHDKQNKFFHSFFGRIYIWLANLLFGFILPLGTHNKKCVLTKYPRYFTIYSAFLPKSVICLGCFRKKLSHMSIVHVQIHYFCHFVEVSCKDIVAHQFTDFFCLHYSTFE